jgi:hypothetical protein
MNRDPEKIFGISIWSPLWPAMMLILGAVYAIALTVLIAAIPYLPKQWPSVKVEIREV